MAKKCDICGISLINCFRCPRCINWVLAHYLKHKEVWHPNG